MVQFGTGYYNPMERGYEVATHHGHSHEVHEGPKATNDIGVSIGDLGMSLGLGPVPNVTAIASKLRPGAKKLEFVFTGSGKGSGQGQTPEMYGLKQRQALVELGKANRVDFTTHSTVGVYGLAGMDQQGNFSKQSKTFSLNEVKRAIEFAADVAKGGPVVVHTGEFQRPVADAEWNKDDKWKGKFEMYPGEEERTSYRVVDTRTGSLIQEARKNRKVSRPVWNRFEEGNDFWQEKGGQSFTDPKGNTVKPGDYIDYFGNKIDPEERVPVFDSKNQQFKVQQLEWTDLQKEAEEMTDRAKDAWREWKKGRLPETKFKDSYWVRFAEAKSENEIKVKPEEAYIIATLETQAANSRGWAVYYGGDFEEYVKNIKKLEKAKEFYEQIESSMDESEKWRLKQQARDLLPGLVPDDAKFPTQVINDHIKEFQKRLRYSREASASQWAQAEEAKETIRNVQSADGYALKEAYDSYARLAMEAMRQTDDLQKKGQLRQGKPLQVAMENLFPEQYGAHPDEIIDLVKGSREKMVELLKQNKISEDEAKKRAESHITITFDTGHLNMWRKYWKADPGKTLLQNDNDFNDWMLEKVKKMAPYIGHVHLDDNYGYHDDHLAPGEGNTPVRDIVKTLKESGYKGELIVEPGADYTTDVTGFHSVMKTWRHFGMPVYGKGSGISQGRGWGQVGYGFFGQNQPPYFVFGGYSPSEDWTLWSGVPLE
ncbi:hypothetical protein COV20_01920 [Candidatus Woesearchaeota archaeon CG10_big_fil_rev_8_21_14_0_10_45_16]|nr:MAG: hypothetical protein COV20_01920 [Candidatus Woesearchaeota archaeon CG10_big_fil_rev_8_21_14_0_10_45_16]